MRPRAPGGPETDTKVAPVGRQDAVFVGAIACVVVAAWALMWIGGSSPGARWLDHGVSVGGGFEIWPFLPAWIAMTTAMMLPTTLPLVLGFRGLIRRRSDRTLLIALVLSAYVLIWATFGVLALAMDRVVHIVVSATPWLTAYPQVVPAAVLIVAGVAQLAPITRRCLDACRSPRGILLSGWHGRRPAVEAAAIGVRHGLFCIGCCWPLMLTLFALAAGSVAWMLAVAAVMFAEKVTPRGDWLRVPIAGVLILSGVYTLGGL